MSIHHQNSSPDQSRALFVEVSSIPTNRPSLEILEAVATREQVHPFGEFARANRQAIEKCLQNRHFGAIISGGQTGTDTAAFVFAEEKGIPRCGFAPRGYCNETGEIRESFRRDMILPAGEYGLLEGEEIKIETEKAAYLRNKLYAERTEQNARYSHGTLILDPGHLTDGTLLTKECALRYQRPEHVLIVPLRAEGHLQRTLVQDWLCANSFLFLNIAGPRESHGVQFGIEIQEESLKLFRAAL